MLTNDRASAWLTATWIAASVALSSPRAFRSISRIVSLSAATVAPAAATLIPSTASENFVMSNPQRFHTLPSTVKPATIGCGVAFAKSLKARLSRSIALRCAARSGSSWVDGSSSVWCTS